MSRFRYKSSGAAGSGYNRGSSSVFSRRGRGVGAGGAVGLGGSGTSDFSVDFEGAAVAEGDGGADFAATFAGGGRGCSAVGLADFVGGSGRAVGAGFAAWASWRGASDRDAAGLRWNTPLRLPAIPGARETVRPLVLCTVTPASGWEVSVETGCPHFGQFGNWPMQC